VPDYSKFDCQIRELLQLTCDHKLYLWAQRKSKRSYLQVHYLFRNEIRLSSDRVVFRACRARAYSEMCIFGVGLCIPG